MYDALNYLTEAKKVHAIANERLVAAKARNRTLDLAAANVALADAKLMVNDAKMMVAETNEPWS